MMATSEIYVLCPQRTLTEALRFLERFVPRREEVAEDYWFPENADAHTTHTSDALHLIRLLEETPTGTYGIYWNNREDVEPFQGMLFFTRDGGMIAGLVVKGENATSYLEKLAHEVGGKWGLVANEERPPDTTTDFAKWCTASAGARLIDGTLIG